jgi:hypothetical protein
MGRQGAAHSRRTLARPGALAQLRQCEIPTWHWTAPAAALGAPQLRILSVLVNDRPWRSHPLRSIATQHHRPYRLRAMP